MAFQAPITSRLKLISREPRIASHGARPVMATLGSLSGLTGTGSGSRHSKQIAVIAKVRNDVEKLRLILDLRRSGVNQKVKTSERLVLPRLVDLMNRVGEPSRP